MAFLDLDGLEYFKGKENAQIAPVESSNTASQAYEIGECFWYGGNLYKTTHDIALGGTITTSGGNANCELVVLSEKINADKTSVENMISGIEHSTTASKDYAVGNYFILYDVLYKVTDAITLGGTITPNTNCVPAKIADDVSNFKSTAEEQISTVEDYALGAYEQKTINNVDIVSFNDGADNIPIKELMVNIEPIQDLHGQDAPYPAGGGKNKWNTQPYVSTNVGYNSAEGTEASFQEGSGATVSGNSISYSVDAWQGFFFKTSPLPAGTYHLHVDLSAITNARVSIYTVGSDNKIGIPSNYTVSAAIDSNRNVEEGGYVAIYIGSNTAQTITFSNYQIESGSAYTSWSPFANICPITGWTGCEVTRDNSNLLNDVNPTVLNAYFNTATISANDNNRIIVIPCKPSTTYTFKWDRVALSADSESARIVSFTEPPDIGSTGSIKVATINESSPVGTFTTGANDNYLAIYFGNITRTDISATLSASQLNLGSEALPHEAYNPTVLSVTFPDGQTVYGGKYDFVSGSGDSKYAKIVKSDTSGWVRGSAQGYYFEQNDLPTPDGTQHDDVLCNKLKPSVSGFNTVRRDATYKTINIRTEKSYASVAEMVADLGELEFVYPIATPTEISLTPQPISTLKGENNIWADCGSIAELQYSADPTTSSQESETLIKAIIAPVLTGMVADTALSANDFRIVGDTLYKITASVASGGTLTPNTNCVATTIGEEITSILNS